MKTIDKLLCLVLIVVMPSGSLGQTPELSADDPIAYTSDNGILIATGNAVYEDENSRVEADEIRYDRNKEHIEATGNVRVTREGLRLLTSHLIYDTESKTVTSGPFRAGYPPLFIEGESFSGTLESIDFSKVSLYFREPVSNSPKLEVQSGKWESGKSITGSGLRLKAFGGLKIPLPAFQYAFGAPRADVDLKLGYRTPLGAYIQSKWLYPLSKEFSLGGNFDIFTNRGLLIGPAMEWERNDGRFFAYVDSGWIHDHNFEERNVDFLGQPIEQSRGFVEFGLRTRDEGALQFQARGTYLSDSEVLRDFRREDYFEQFHPDHFADFTWQKESFLLNIFARRQINDAYGMVERLPEIQAEWLPSELANSNIYFQANAGAMRYRLSEVVPSQISILFPDSPLGLRGTYPSSSLEIPSLQESPYHDRLDGSATFTRPFHGPAGIDLVLRAGGRWSEYHRGSTDSMASLTEERTVGELGFDLSQTLARTYSVNKPQWNMQQIRHISRLSVQYRWHTNGDDPLQDVPLYDRYLYHSRRPSLDLADIRHTDNLRDWNVARIGWENLLLVADADAAFVDYLSLNLFQDILFSADEGEDEWDALYAEIDYTPFPWLDIQLRQKIRTEAEGTEAAFLRTTLRSADLWSLTLQAEYLDAAIEQYELEARYRIGENIGLLGYWHYDARMDTWTRQQYGISRRFGNVWQLDFYVAFYNENLREDDFSIGMRLLWLSF